MTRSAPLFARKAAATLPRDRRLRIAASLITTAGLAAAVLAPAPAFAQRPPATTVLAEGQTPASTPASEPAQPTPLDESAPPRGGEHARRLAVGGHCQLSLVAGSPLLTSGEPATLSGTLVCGDAASEAGVPVTIFQRTREPGGASALSEVGTATTAADGTFQFTSAALAANSVFVVRAALAHQARAAVKVGPLVTIGGPPAGATLFTRGNAGGHNRLTFTGTVTPHQEGATVALQREYVTSREQWHTVKIGHVDAQGLYSLTHTFRMPGPVNVRVVVHPLGFSRTTASEVLSYTVAQTQNPRLTIETSADPVTAGTAITISGIAAGAPGTSVALLARTPGQPYTVLAHVAANAGGAYSFTVTPTQSTFYMAATAATVSSQLEEGLRYPLELAPPPSSVASGTPLTLTGTAIPAPEGELVVLEQQYPFGIGFHPVAEGALGIGSAFSLTATLNGVGVRVMRVRLHADAQSIGSTSAPFTVLLTPKTAAPIEPAPPA